MGSELWCGDLALVQDVRFIETAFAALGYPTKSVRVHNKYGTDVCL